MNVFVGTAGAAGHQQLIGPLSVVLSYTQLTVPSRPTFSGAIDDRSASTAYMIIIMLY